MQHDKFAAAKAMIHKEPATLIQKREIWDVDSPEGVSKGSMDT